MELSTDMPTRSSLASKMLPIQILILPKCAIRGARANSNQGSGTMTGRAGLSTLRCVYVALFPPPFIFLRTQSAHEFLVVNRLKKR